MKRVEITKEATAVVEALKVKHGELIFHQSGGCCDGSAPMIFEKDDMYLDESDILLGSVAGVNFYMNQDQFEYWKHTHSTKIIQELMEEQMFPLTLKGMESAMAYLSK